MRVRQARRLSQIAIITAALVALAACSSSGSTGTGGSTSSSSTTTAGTAAAAAITKKYTDNPSEFPVSAPLPNAVPAGLTFGYLQCSAPTCAQQAALLQAAVAVVQGKLQVVKAGSSAQELQGAMSSLLSSKPAALLIPSVQPDLIAAQIKQAQAAGIPISMGIINPEQYGIGASTFGAALIEQVGKLMADWVIANEPPNAKIVFYTIPELNFMVPEEAAFRAEITKLCASCGVRTVKAPIAGIGSTNPALVLSDLEGHPDTTVAVFGANDTTTGLPAALTTAGLKTPYIGFGPTPSNLADIQSGAQAAGLGLDYNVLAWMFVDEGLRLVQKAPVSADEKQGVVPVQWVTKSNLTGDISKGFAAYPDYVARYTKLWTGK